MAKRRAATRTTIALAPVSRASAPARRGPSPLVAKLKKRLESARKSARKAKMPKVMADVVTVAGAAALGAAQKQGIVPARIGPVDTSLAVGAIGAFLLPRFIGGKASQLVHDASLGVLAVAAHQIASGATTALGDDPGGAGWDDE